MISKNQGYFLISKNLFCDIKMIFLFKKKKKNCDITKYEDFPTDEMITPIKKASAGVFSPIKMADRDAVYLLKCACALIICRSYNFSKELKCKNYFVISQNRHFDITKS